MILGMMGEKMGVVVEVADEMIKARALFSELEVGLGMKKMMMEYQKEQKMGK